MSLKRIWYVWVNALGIKPQGLTNREADLAALIRTLIYAVPAFCIIANCGRTFGVW